MTRFEKIKIIKKEMLKNVEKLERILNRQKKYYDLFEILEVYKLMKLMRIKMDSLQEIIHKI